MAGPIDRWRERRASQAIPGAILQTPTDETSLDSETGAVTSRQGAEIILPAAAIEGLWDPEHLERVARTYWITLRRFTLGLMHVDYTETERSVVLLTRRLPLLTFKAPEYEMDRGRGIVRWRIARGLLVSGRGRDGDGYLEIDIQRRDEPEKERVRLLISVEVANYYPALTGLSRRIYVQTQSRIHVVACNFFLRRLVKRELAPSRVGQFAGPRSAEQAPEPNPVRERDASERPS
ncbi:MAG: hypothetical protein H0X42_00275 [Solirubrobacterales bacterium]|nr:hypothetical protein [Solirubrobacterales bacterium]